MTFTTIRIVIALLGIGGLGLWLWNIHDGLADARVRNALAQAKEDNRADTIEQVEAEENEQDQQRHDARTSQKAGREVRRVDSVGDGWSNCPSVPASFGRLLNAIGKKGSAATKLAGEVRGAPETSGD